MSRVERDPAKGLNAALAATLKGELAASGMTFDQLAEVTGISKRTLLRLLSTKERHIDIAQATTIAEAFDMSLVDLLVAAEARRNRTPNGGSQAQGA